MLHAILLLASLKLNLVHAAPLKVVVDPGHGGRDQGAIREGTAESDITLKVSRLLHRLLSSDHRFQSSLTRNEDQFLTLADRARIAHDKKADLFVSIHVNSNPDSRARGAEFYFQNHLPPDEESMRLAHAENGGEAASPSGKYEFLEDNDYSPDVASIVSDLLDSNRVFKSSQLSKTLKENWTGSRKTRSSSVMQAPFYVLSQIKAPSALVELGFITNVRERQELADAAIQKQMAEDLYKGLVKFKESLDK